MTYVRETRTARSTGVTMMLYDTSAPENVFDTDGGRWVTYCTEHHALCNHDTLELARRFMSAPEEFCEGCTTILRSKPRACTFEELCARCTVPLEIGEQVVDIDVVEENKFDLPLATAEWATVHLRCSAPSTYQLIVELARAPQTFGGFESDGSVCVDFDFGYLMIDGFESDTYRLAIWGNEIAELPLAEKRIQLPVTAGHIADEARKLVDTVKGQVNA